MEILLLGSGSLKNSHGKNKMPKANYFLWVYKEASHFLRNIGMGKGLGNLDRHILKNLDLLFLSKETGRVFK